MKNFSRRDMIRWSLSGGAGLTLASLATGLPVSFLRSGGIAHAQDEPAENPTYLILATSSSGDPLNANCPGSYANPSDDNDLRWAVEHPTVAELGSEPIRSIVAPGTIGEVAYGAPDFDQGHLCRLGDTECWAARPWADLPSELRAKMSILRHQTYNNAHTEFRQVTEFQGGLKGPGRVGVEALPSFISQENAARLGTVIEAPISLGGPSYAFRGAWLRTQDPDSLREVFAESGAFRGLEPVEFADIRDAALDSIYGEIRTSGTHAQKKFLDGHVRGREDARALSEILSASLAPVETAQTSVRKQIIAAVALIEANATPVVTISLPFGGDNHQDSDLYTEVNQQVEGIEGIHWLWEELGNKGLRDQVTFATLAVFGRKLKRGNSGGRGHYGKDHAMVMFGPHVKPGLLGQLDSELAAGPIEDVPVEETLATAGKTLARATGVPEEIIEERIVGGRAF